jgi:hypothetical protein
MKNLIFLLCNFKKKKLVIKWKALNLFLRREDPKTLKYLIGIINLKNKIKFPFRKDPEKLNKSTLGITA